jgi:O-antigen/teichoic acid export membrane protein
MTELADAQEVHEADRFRDGVGRSALTSLFSIVVGIGGAVLISRRFGSELFGRYVTVSAPLAMLTLLSSLQEQVGFMHVASPLVAERGRFSALAWKTFLFSEALTVLAGVIVFGASWWFLVGPAESPDLVLPVAVLLIGYVLMGNIAWNIDGVLNARRESAQLARVRIVESVLQPALPLLLSLWWLDLRALVVGAVATTVFAAVVRMMAVRGRLTHRIDPHEWAQAKQDFVEVRRTGLQIYPGAIAGGLLDQTAIWIVRAVVGGGAAGDRVTGAFGRANNLTWRLQELTFRVSALLLPSLSDTRSRDDHDGYRSTGRMAVVAYVAPLAGLVAIIAGCSANVLRVFGSDFVDGAEALRILVLVSLLIAIDIFVGMFLISLGLARVMARTSVVGALAMLVVIYPMTHQWGATGASFAVLLGQSVATGWRMRMLQQHLPGGVVSLLPERAWRLLVPPAAAGAATWAVANGSDSIVRGLLAGSVGVVVFVAVWVALGLRSVVVGRGGAA